MFRRASNQTSGSFSTWSATRNAICAHALIRRCEELDNTIDWTRLYVSRKKIVRCRMGNGWGGIAESHESKELFIQFQMLWESYAKRNHSVSQICLDINLVMYYQRIYQLKNTFQKYLTFVFFSFSLYLYRVFRMKMFCLNVQQCHIYIYMYTHIYMRVSVCIHICTHTNIYRYILYIYVYSLN